MLRRVSKGKGEAAEDALGLDLSEDLNSEERNFVAEAVVVEAVQAEEGAVHDNAPAEASGMVEVAAEVPAKPVNPSAQSLYCCPVKGCSYKAEKKTLLVNHLVRCFLKRVKSLKLEHPDWTTSGCERGWKTAWIPRILQSLRNGGALRRNAAHC
jgi:hypothetical protein